MKGKERIQGFDSERLRWVELPHKEGIVRARLDVEAVHVVEYMHENHKNGIRERYPDCFFALLLDVARPNGRWDYIFVPFDAKRINVEYDFTVEYRKRNHA